jgi:hypothetical protein
MDDKLETQKYMRAYYLKNRDKYILREKEYREQNPLKIKEKHKRYREKNRKSINFRNNEYKKRNKAKIFKYNNEWKKKQYKTNILFKLNSLLKAGLRRIVVDGQIKKSKLKFNVFDLKAHLERQFTPEMNWDNYGTYWHIDHVIPLSWFKTQDDLLNKGWGLENLQPLPAKLNIKKSNKNNKTLKELVGDLNE